MQYGEDGPTRIRDDETQAYLVQFFRTAGAKPGFEEVFNALTPDELEKLRSLANA
jgi:importin-9